MKYKWQFYSIFILHALRIILASIVIPLFFKRIIDIISSAGPDRSSASSELFGTVAWIAAFLAVAWVFGRSTQFSVARFQSQVIRDLYNLAFEKIQAHSYMFFANSFSGSLVSKCRKFVRAFESMHDVLIDNFWSSTIVFVSVFTVFMFQALPIALVFLAVLIVYVAIVFYLSKIKYKYDVEEAAAEAKITGYLADAIGNVLAIKAASSLPREIKGFGRVTENEEKLRRRAWNFGTTINAVQAALTMALQVSVVTLTTYLWLSGKISAGLFVLVQSYAITVGNVFWDLGRAMTRFTKSFSEMKEIVDIFREIPDVLDPPEPEECRIKEGEIEIKDMFFNYSRGSDVFNHFQLKIRPGEKIGLVGHSGSGKSTITKLILRFIDISSGEILIDGQDIRKIRQADLRRNISYISQEPVLFHRTIRENIAYSYPEATEEEIMDAARKAHADQFISRLAQGYDTLVGERGVKLSGGERQRVAIARAILKPAPILILDEATSSLDSISEFYIQDALKELTKDKTTIAIAHRLSTIQKMDRIIVLDRGKIVEEGAHAELLKKGGFYADLWGRQTGGFL